MTRDERKAAFHSLFDSLPGKRIDRIRKICSVLCCPENTVRVWLCSTAPRVIPESKIRILQRELTPLAL